MNDFAVEYFAVVDVETNWNNEAMSAGVVIGDAEFCVVDKRYYVIHPECETGGMYSGVLRDVNKELITDCSRAEAVADIKNLLTKHGVKDILAYNAPFDYKCLHELNGYVWRDILPIAANRNFNGRLPDNCEYFRTGLLKRGRGLENVMRLVYWRGFTEHHNGLTDALDELQLMQIVNQPLEAYKRYNPKQIYVPNVRQTYSARRSDSLLNNYRYVVDELCGGSVRLLDFSRTFVDAGEDGAAGAFTDCFYLQCSRCGFKWSQDAESFFLSRKCPECSK